MSSSLSWVPWAAPWRASSRGSSRASSEGSEYFTANDLTPDPDKKVVSWDQANFEEVSVRITSK